MSQPMQLSLTSFVIGPFCYYGHFALTRVVVRAIVVEMVVVSGGRGHGGGGSFFLSVDRRKRGIYRTRQRETVTTFNWGEERPSLKNIVIYASKKKEHKSKLLWQKK